VPVTVTRRSASGNGQIRSIRPWKTSCALKLVDDELITRVEALVEAGAAAVDHGDQARLGGPIAEGGEVGLELGEERVGGGCLAAERGVVVEEHLPGGGGVQAVEQEGRLAGLAGEEVDPALQAEGDAGAEVRRVEGDEQVAAVAALVRLEPGQGVARDQAAHAGADDRIGRAGRQQVGQGVHQFDQQEGVALDRLGGGVEVQDHRVVSGRAQVLEQVLLVQQRVEFGPVVGVVEVEALDHDHRTGDLGMTVGEVDEGLAAGGAAVVRDARGQRPDLGRRRRVEGDDVEGETGPADLASRVGQAQADLLAAGGGVAGRDGIVRRDGAQAGAVVQVDGDQGRTVGQQQVAGEDEAQVGAVVGDRIERGGGGGVMLAQQAGGGRRGARQEARRLCGVGLQEEEAAVEGVRAEGLVGEVEEGDLDQARIGGRRSPAQGGGIGPDGRPGLRAVEGAQTGQRQGAVVQAAGGDQVRAEGRQGLAQDVAGGLGGSRNRCHELEDRCGEG